MQCFSIWHVVSSNRQDFCTPVFHGCYNVINKTLGNSVPLLKKCNLQVSESKRRPWSHSNALSKHVSNLLNWNQFRRACWPFRTLHYFRFKHILPKMGYMRFGIIMLNKGISNGCSVRHDMKSEYFVCIPSGCQSTILNDMQLHTFTHTGSTPYHLISSSVLRLFTNESEIISSAPFPPYQNISAHSRLNRDSSVNSI